MKRFIIFIHFVLFFAVAPLEAQRTVRITNQSVANGTGHSISAVIKTGTGTVLHNRQFVFNPLGAPVDFSVPATGTIVVNFGLQGDATLVEGSVVTHQALNNWTGAGTYVRFRAEFVLNNSPQTVSLSFQSGADLSSLELGRSVTGQATGAQAGNPYNFSSVSGGVSIAGNSTTGAFTITANSQGPFQIKVWASEGNGFSRSNDATQSGTIVDALKHKVRVSFDNRESSTPRTFKVWQNGSLIAARTIAPGQLQVETIEVPTADPVTVTVSGKEVLIDGVVWTPGDNVDVETDVIVIQPEEVPNAADPVKTEKVSPPTPPKPPGDSSVWKSVDATNKDEAVTAVQSAEGVEKIVSAVNKVSDSLVSTESIVAPDSMDPFPQGANGATLNSVIASSRSKVPAPPTILVPVAPVATPVFTTPVFAVGSISLSASYDLSPYVNVIAPFRLVATAVLGIIFFIAYVRVIRGAFA